MANSQPKPQTEPAVVPEIPDIGGASAEPELVPIFDFDAVLQADIEADENSDDAREVVAVFRAFGANWRLVQPSNVLHGLRLSRVDEDPVVIIDYIRVMVHPEDRPGFMLALSRLEKLTVQQLLQLFNGMQEAVLARPTSPPPARRPGSTTRRPARR